jgi:hypothetical protein
MRRRVFLFCLYFSFTTLSITCELNAQCASVMFNGSDTGDLINLEGISISTSQMNAAANYWAACPSYGQGFPRFTTSGVSAAIAVTVAYIGGVGQNCGLATPLSSTSFRVELWDQGHDTSGNLYSCNVTDTLAHELGHVLDLANSSCPGYIMGPSPLSFMNGHEVAGTRSVAPQECTTVTDRWTTSFDLDAGGGDPNGPPPCI